jgi:class 3 adenylate cyclase
LADGAYRLRSYEMPDPFDFRVERQGVTSRVELPLGPRISGETPSSLMSGQQVLALHNTTADGMLVRLERRAPREDALTAARASSLALFRELFPSEVLSPGQLVSVASVALVACEVEGADDLLVALGDAPAFAVVSEQFRILRDAVAREGGAVVKTVGSGLLAAFSDAAAAVRAALGFQRLMMGTPKTRQLRLRVVVHKGSALVSNVDDRLDYFGRNLSFVLRAPQRIRGGEVLLTRAVAADPLVDAMLRQQALSGDVVSLEDALAPGQWGVCLQAPVGDRTSSQILAA